MASIGRYLKSDCTLTRTMSDGSKPSSFKSPSDRSDLTDSSSPASGGDLQPEILKSSNYVSVRTRSLIPRALIKLYAVTTGIVLAVAVVVGIVSYLKLEQVEKS